MDEIVCYDADGNILNHFTQWDVDQILVIRGADTSSAPQIHFSNSAMENALVIQSSINLGGIFAIVPSVLLQHSLPIIAHLYYSNMPKTKYSVRIPVMPRNKPEDYVYSETIGGIVLNGADIVVSNTKPSNNSIIWFDTSVMAE